MTLFIIGKNLLNLVGTISNVKIVQVNNGLLSMFATSWRLIRLQKKLFSRYLFYISQLSFWIRNSEVIITLLLVLKQMSWNFNVVFGCRFLLLFWEPANRKIKCWLNKLLIYWCPHCHGGCLRGTFGCQFGSVTQKKFWSRKVIRFLIWFIFFSLLFDIQISFTAVEHNLFLKWWTLLAASDSHSILLQKIGALP